MGQTLNLLVRLQIHTGIWKTIQSFIKNLKIQILRDPANPLLSIYSKEIKSLSQRAVCTPVLTIALFTLTKIQKRLKCLMTDVWIKKKYLCRMKYYSAFKRKDIFSFETTWKNLQDNMLSEISQIEQHKYHLISLICRILRS